MADSPNKTLSDWRRLASEELGGADPDKLMWETPEGICVKPLYTKPLGKNRRWGILKDQHSRKKFLSNSCHRIYFQFTPKHCSWLNPIENWFSVLQRRVLNNGNFYSVKDLQQKINGYINYHNATLFKPINWQFTGFTKAKQIAA